MAKSLDSVCKFTVQGQQSRIDPINFVLERHPTALGRHAYEAYGLHLVAEGTGTLTFGDESFPLHKGDLFWVEPHTDFSVDGETIAYYYVSFHCPNGRNLFGGTNERVRHGFDRLNDVWQSAMEQCDEGNFNYLTGGLVLYTLAFWLPHREKRLNESQQIVNRVYEYAAAHFCEPDLSLKQLCRAEYYNETYVSALFKKETGVAFAQYVRQLRISRACAYLERNDLSIGEVAYFTGFNDPLYFSKVFKSIMHCSPSAYRAHIRKGS